MSSSLLSIALLMWILIIIIQSSDQVCEDGDIRLSGGRHYREGRVEVCRNQQWGRVCDDGWDTNDSAVVCRQLGLSEQGAEAIVMQSTPDNPSTLSFFALDDVGCSGSESNLLDCLPQHNCKMDRDKENAGVQCLRKGVKLEYGSNQEINNTLFTVNGIHTQKDNETTLLCSTDRANCCINEFNIPGSWFLPNGSRISTNTQSLHNIIALGNQTVGLKLSPDLPSRIYHCEMMDRENITHHLYAGVYPEDEGNVTNVSGQYDRKSQIITCTSTGGPATDVSWSKDNTNIILSAASNVGLYEYSQIIINITSATYENRLRIVDKSSEAAGIYTCKVINPRGSMNGSLYIQVCRDMELRVNNKSNGHGRTAEVCINDEWHETTSAKVANNSQSRQDIYVIADSTSVMIKWSGQQSIPSDTINGYDLSCTTTSLSVDGQIHEVRVPNISTSTTAVQVSGLLPGMAYECCVNAHIQTNTPLDLISSSCITTLTTKSKKISTSNRDDLAAGLGIGLGLLLVVCVGSIFINLFLIKRLLKKDQGTKVKFSSTNQVFEEDDSEHDERLVGNPIYGDSLPGASETDRNTDRESYDVLRHNVGAMQQGVIPIGAYEMISNLPNRASDRDNAILQTDDASAYAKLGAEGVTAGGGNVDEDVKAGVEENELRSPYANIFEISPSD